MVNKIILEIQWSDLMKKVFSKDKLVDKISFNLKDNDLIFSLFNELVILIFYLNNGNNFQTLIMDNIFSLCNCLICSTEQFLSYAYLMFFCPILTETS